MSDNRDGLPTAKEMIPALVLALKNFGGRATVRQLEQQVATQLNIAANLLAIPHDKSRSEFQYRLGWTRTYAKKQGIVTSSTRNQWELAEPQS